MLIPLRNFIFRVLWLNGYRLSSIFGALCCRLGICKPNAEQVIRVFGPTVAPHAKRIARDIASARFKRQFILTFRPYFQRVPMDFLVEWRDQERILEFHRAGKPAILMFWHMGGYFGLASGLYKLNIPMDIMRMDAISTELPGLNFLSVKSGTAGERAQILRVMMNRLRGGGLVCLSMDSGAGDAPTIQTTCLGLTVELRKGIMSLTKLSGAPVIPIISRWADSHTRIEMRALEPLIFSDESRADTDAFEREFANRAIALQEKFLREYPEEISWIRFCRMFKASRTHKTKDRKKTEKSE